MHALRIERLVYRWPGAERSTLEIGALSLASGESLFLYGPSGCGKSTLLSAIAGVVDVPKGAIHVADLDLGALHGGARDRFRVDHIGMIFQVFNLVPWLSARENVLLPCTFSSRRSVRTGDDPAGSAERLLNELGLSDPSLTSKQAHELSVGQQQRVAAARALIDAALRAANPEARLIPIGFASGQVPQIPANLLLVKNLTVIGLYWGGYLRFRPDVLTGSLRTLLDWYAAGRLHPPVGDVLPLERTAEALALLRDRKARGKVVVQIGPDR
jgi:putative ABC transport system ATP-binding protein